MSGWVSCAGQDSKAQPLRDCGIRPQVLNSQVDPPQVRAKFQVLAFEIYPAGRLDGGGRFSGFGRQPAPQKQSALLSRQRLSMKMFHPRESDRIFAVKPLRETGSGRMRSKIPRQRPCGPASTMKVSGARVHHLASDPARAGVLVAVDYFENPLPILRLGWFDDIFLRAGWKERFAHHGVLEQVE